MTARPSVAVSSERTDRALRALGAELGAEHVLTGAAALEFRDPFCPPGWEDYEASGVVQPGSVQEIQAVLRIAKEHGVPIWTTSTGRNNGLGGASPRVKGSIGMNLRRMDRILEINEELGYAEVEPGVTWRQLYEAIEAGGHRLMVSTTDLGWGSIIGNSLEHGGTYMPYGADFMAPCGMEVVLADGDVVRTGMGAMPGNKAWHLFRRGLGPMMDQLFMQSNYGVVTKMGVWLMPKPEVYAPLWMDIPREDDLIALMDTLRGLRMDRTLEGVPCLYNAVTLASTAFGAQRSRWYDGTGAMPESAIDQMSKDLGIGRWTVHAALWDDEPVTDHKIAKITRAIEQIPGARVRSAKHAPEDIPNLPVSPDRVLGGVPNLEFMQMLGWYGNSAGAHTGTGLVAPLTGSEAWRLHSLLRDIIENEFGLDYIAYPALNNARSYIHVFGVIYDVEDEADSRRAYDACRKTLIEGAKAGFGEYRAHLDNMDLAQSQYSFNDNAHRRLCESIKDAVDPAGILSPGKQGIWPRAYRDAGETP